MRPAATLLAMALMLGFGAAVSEGAGKSSAHETAHHNAAPPHHEASHGSAPQNHEAHHPPAQGPVAHHESSHNGAPGHHNVPHMNANRVGVNSSHRGSSGYHRGYGRGGSYGYHRRYRNNYPRRYPVKPNPETLLARARLKKLLKLKEDLEGVKPKLTVTQGQRTRLAGDLTDIAEGPARISPAPVKQLAASLADSLGRRAPAKPLDSEAMALYLRELMNSGGTPRSHFKPAIARGEALLRSSGVAQADAEGLAGEMRTVLEAFNPDATAKAIK